MLISTEELMMDAFSGFNGIPTLRSATEVEVAFMADLMPSCAGWNSPNNKRPFVTC